MRKPGGSEKNVRRMRGAVNCTTGMAMIDRHPRPQRRVDAAWEIRPSSCRQAYSSFSFKSRLSGRDLASPEFILSTGRARAHCDIYLCFGSVSRRGYKPHSSSHFHTHSSKISDEHNGLPGRAVWYFLQKMTRDCGTKAKLAAWRTGAFARGCQNAFLSERGK